MIALYLLAGINHFRNPAFYHLLIPPYFPNPVLLNYISGIAEIAGAIGLCFKSTRKWAAIGIMVMLVAFLPAHIYHVQKNGCIDPVALCIPAWVAWVRLLIFQPLLIWWAKTNMNR